MACPDSEVVRTIRERLLENGLVEFDRSFVRIGKRIGNGGQGTVYEASVYEPEYKKPITMAVKKFEATNAILALRYPREILSIFMSRVLTLRGFFFDEDSSLCLIMPKFCGDLRGLIDTEMKNGMSCESGVGGASPFEDSVAFAIIVDLAMGMKSLHDIGVVHRDLKAMNVLVGTAAVDPSTADGIRTFYPIVIADFEASERTIGTGFWRAPEVLLSLKTRTQLTNDQWRAADVYSFGMTCYEVLTGEIPFHGYKSNRHDIVLDGGRPELPDHVPEFLGNIIRRCWHPNPSCRPDFGDILEALKEADKYGHTEAYGNAESLRTMLETYSDHPRDLDSYLLRLHELVQKHSNQAAYASNIAPFLNCGFRFVDCALQFSLEFGWSSFTTHPKLAFAEFIRREKLMILMSIYYRELRYNYVVHNNNSGQRWPDFKLEIVEMMLLARNVFQTLSKRENVLAWEGGDHDLTLKEKLRILRDITEDLTDVIGGASALRVIEVFLKMLAMENRLGTNIDEITKFYHLMKFMIRGRFLKKYKILGLLCIACIVLSLIFRFEFWNHVFRWFGIFDFYDVFFGLFWSLLEFEVYMRLKASFPKYKVHLSWVSVPIWIFSLDLRLRSYGFRRLLSWKLVGCCFWVFVQFVYDLIYLLSEYLYLKLVPPPSSSTFSRFLDEETADFARFLETKKQI